MASDTRDARRFRRDKVRTMQTATAEIIRIDYTEAKQELAETLRDVFGDAKSGAKVAAKVANRNDRTAANILAGRNLGDALTCLHFYANVPQFRAAWRKLAKQTSEIDPMFERDLMALFQTYQKTRGQ